MKTFIDQIIPRQDQDTSVMNVEVKFLIPEKEHRNNRVVVTVFIDKNIDSMNEINRLALEKAHDVIKKIIDLHQK